MYLSFSVPPPMLSSFTMNGGLALSSPHQDGPTPLVDDFPTPLKITVVGAGIGGAHGCNWFTASGPRGQCGQSVFLIIYMSCHMLKKTLQVYEQSRFANEIGAAVHLAPNANGILRRWGIHAEDFGANPTECLIERLSTGSVRMNIDLSGPNKQWQHPWLLVHRVNLHDHLKRLATADEESGQARKASYFQ